MPENINRTGPGIRCMGGEDGKLRIVSFDSDSPGHLIMWYGYESPIQRISCRRHVAVMSFGGAMARMGHAKNCTLGNEAETVSQEDFDATWDAAYEWVDGVLVDDDRRQLGDKTDAEA